MQARNKKQLSRSHPLMGEKACHAKADGDAIKFSRSFRSNTSVPVSECARCAHVSVTRGPLWDLEVQLLSCAARERRPDANRTPRALSFWASRSGVPVSVTTRDNTNK